MQTTVNTKTREAAVTNETDRKLPCWLSCVDLQLREGVRLTQDTSNRWHLSHPGREVSFILPSRRLREVFADLATQQLSMFDVFQSAAENDGFLSVMEQLRRLWRPGLLMQSLRQEGDTLARFYGNDPMMMLPHCIDPSVPIELTQSACIRRESDFVVIDSVECGARVELRNPRLFSIPVLLMKAANCSDLAHTVGLPLEHITAIATWLSCIGVLRVFGQAPEWDHPPGWSFADRIFHARSRMGRHVGGYGATFPLRQALPEPPVTASSRGGRRIPLCKPDLAKLSANDPPFTTVLESRRSLREQGAEAINVEELGCFLYRSARVRSRHRSEHYDFTSRPYPSGGALYEIEIYPLINRCSGLEPSLYWYDASEHCLEHIANPSADTQELAGAASRSAGGIPTPQVVLILAARFDRVFWKYESMGYALILKNIGALYEAMYLVATAMGLAPCALGGGDSECFCRAAGTKFWEESSVGEFLLGTRK